MNSWTNSADSYEIPKVVFYQGMHYTLFAMLKTITSKIDWHSKIDKTKILMTNGSLMKVESITKVSILQYV